MGTSFAGGAPLCGRSDSAACRSCAAQCSRQRDGRQRPSTADAVAAAFARVFPVIGDRPVVQLCTSELQALVKALSATLARATVEATYRAVAAVLRPRSSTGC
jgi:hypothetical protein